MVVIFHSDAIPSSISIISPSIYMTDSGLSQALYTCAHVAWASYTRSRRIVLSTTRELIPVSTAAQKDNGVTLANMARPDSTCFEDDRLGSFSFPLFLSFLFPLSAQPLSDIRRIDGYALHAYLFVLRYLYAFSGG